MDFENYVNSVIYNFRHRKDILDFFEDNINLTESCYPKIFNVGGIPYIHVHLGDIILVRYFSKCGGYINKINNEYISDEDFINYYNYLG